ncbi:penicillin-binding protein 2 [Alishewanella sp. SMS8]|uniref:penicillin-binding protein 2 n=1 Tax=Alishewanella sp. SMS8 TaxID=2994676 RepID=UPI002741B167|nr:penicillin-binding protein 2 [Alishewanella sp. SMS8]MDP4946370.1 penicillin-binding protein 2 [Alishewanella sp.]MDP5035329.1 penicillin-binding protein 2 [Alishewanella sp.]MDP5186303.1 penicillin-binding protein 2 [Alishewanella sp.]MDP5459345.1 penicillin-binding protein 2 [Alishewanella sp. SMS8]
MLKKRVAMQDVEAEHRLFNHRAVFAMVFVVLMFAVIVVNMYHLQVTSYQAYQTRSEGNRIKVLPLAPNRGLITDRNGILLAENRPVFSLELVPEQISDMPTTLQELSALIEISEEQQTNFLKEVRQQRRFNSITLKEQLNDEEVARISVNLHRLPGVTVEARLSRYYPFGDLFTHALGYIGRINTNDLKQLEENEQLANYAASRDIGKIGLERYYETELHGIMGYQEVEVNNRGRLIRVLRSVPASSGKNIKLNIDVGLQLTAQQILLEKRGAIVAMDPRDGAILAFYSNPSYDPNLFVHGISSKNYNALLNSADRPLINRVTQGVYPPASTIKPHLALLGLETNTISANTRIWDPGFFQLPGVEHRYRDWKRWGHGWVDVYTAIVESCDTFFYDMGVKLGIDRVSDYMQKMGFGEKSGIDIHEESNTIMPSRGWKRARHNQPWYHGDTVAISIGQGYWTITPLQLLVSTAVLLNNGLQPTPHIVRELSNDLGTESIDTTPQEVMQVVNPRNWQVVRDAMQQTVTTQKGTAFNAFKGATYTSGGKTGTAQVVSIAQDAKYDANKLDERLRDNAMYIGYAPADAPTIVIAVTVENTGGGGSTAAPIARQMLDYYFSAEVNNNDE